MTCTEFSNEFDILLNSYSDNPSDIKIDEYEKSIYLTQAQEEIIKNLYSGTNKYMEGFEATEKLRRYLDTLNKSEYLSPVETIEGATVFKLPKDLWYITYESIIVGSNSNCLNDRELIVIPVKQDDLYRTQQNPFKRASERRALRIDIENNQVEIITPYTINKYLIRYIVKPTPIILVDLQDLSINGISSKTECSLNSLIHREILEYAVRLALASRVQTTNNNN